MPLEDITITQELPCHSGVITYTGTEAAIPTLGLFTLDGEAVNYTVVEEGVSWRYTFAGPDRVLHIQILDDSSDLVLEHYYVFACHALHTIAQLRTEYLKPSCRKPFEYELVSSVYLSAIDHYRLGQYAECERLLAWIGSFIATYCIDSCAC